MAPDAAKRLKVDDVDLVDFVDHDDGLDIGFLSGYQKPIDQIWFERRLDGAADDEGQIDIGGDDLLPFAAGAADLVSPVIDANDNAPIFFGVGIDFDRDKIASHDDMLKIRRQRFQNASNRAFVNLPIADTDETIETVDRQDAAGTRILGVDV